MMLRSATESLRPQRICHSFQSAVAQEILLLVYNRSTNLIGAEEEREEVVSQALLEVEASMLCKSFYAEAVVAATIQLREDSQSHMLVLAALASAAIRLLLQPHLVLLQSCSLETAVSSLPALSCVPNSRLNFCDHCLIVWALG